MRKISVNNKIWFVVVVDGTRENEKLFIENSNNNRQDIDFLESKELIKYIDRFNLLIKFVGEIMTPTTNYFSLPKSFDISEQISDQQLIENIKLVNEVLKEFKITEPDKKYLKINQSFDIAGANLKSDIFYYRKLKEYFLDYTTYEFIYPKEKKEVHSKKPLKGRIDFIKTQLNKKRYGGGITYKVNDIENSTEWNLDDIYYTTLIELSKEHGSKIDKEKIQDMKEYLEDEGFVINLDQSVVDYFQTKSDNIKNQIFNIIKKIEVSDIHFPVKNALLGFYKLAAIKEKYDILSFHTLGFNWLWENIAKKVLKDNKQFKESETLIPPTINGKEVPLKPDIFSYYNNYKFIGDLKYYTKPEKGFKKEEFAKEWFLYDRATENQYNIIVFIPSDKTEIIGFKKSDLDELITMNLSLKDVLSDMINKTNKCITDVQNLINDLIDGKILNYHSEKTWEPSLLEEDYEDDVQEYEDDEEDE